MSTMYLMSGPSASGKTEWAKHSIEMASKDCLVEPIRYLGIDDFYALFGGSEAYHNHEFEVWMAFFNAIHVAEREGVNVLIDTNAPTVVMRSQFLDWFGGFDQKILIFVNAGLPMCRKLNVKRSRVVPEDQLVHMYNQVEHPTLDEDSRWSEIQCYMHKELTDGMGSFYERYDTPAVTLNKTSSSVIRPYYSCPDCGTGYPRPLGERKDRRIRKCKTCNKVVTMDVLVDA